MTDVDLSFIAEQQRRIRDEMRTIRDEQMLTREQMYLSQRRLDLLSDKIDDVRSALARLAEQVTAGFESVRERLDHREDKQ